jgi:predicted transcriptional regulator
MQRVLKEYIVRKLREPTEKQVNSDIEWVCNSFGLMSTRDKDKTSQHILKLLLVAARQGKGLTSHELAQEVKPTASTVIYHLSKLMKAGFVVKMGSTYELRMTSLVRTIEEINKEVNISMADIKRVARDIDKKIGLEHR